MNDDAGQGRTHTLDDYLGTCGLDHTPHVDEATNATTPPTWDPIPDDTHDFGKKVVERFRRFRTALERNGLLALWRRNYRQYFNGPAAPASSDSGWGWSDSFEILGDSGEVMNVRLAEPRTLITRMVNLACAKPVATRAVATKPTPEAQEAAQIADSVIRNDLDPVEGGQLVREAVELALAVSVGFLDPEWDRLAGEAYLPNDDGSYTYNGKPKLSVRMPDEIAFDLTKRRWKDVWDCIVLQRANRYMMAAQFPDQAERILSAPSLHDSEFKSFRYDDEDTDDIVIFRYMHKSGNRSFLPDGRLALVLEDGTVLRDGLNPYALVDPEQIGIFPITAGNGLGSVYGYATMNDLSPLSQWLTVMTTMAATLVVGYGAPNIAGPAMQSVQIQNMVGGGRYFGLSGTQGEIKPFNLLDDKSLKSILELVRFVLEMGDKHSGTSGLAREPGDGDSGKKVAIVKSMAVQFMSALQQSIVATTKGLSNYMLRMRQHLSSAEEIAELAAGVGAAQQVVSYKASDKFPLVARVEAEAVDPVSQTIEGRQMMVQQLIDMGALQGPSAIYDYMQFLKTGRDEGLFADYLATDNLINRENAELLKGNCPNVLAGVMGVGGDEHDVHVKKHLRTMADPSARDPSSPIAQAGLEHISRHLLAKMGVPFMQGTDQQTGQPYPPAAQQFQAVEQQRQAAAAVNTPPPQGGQPSHTPAPKQGDTSGTGAPSQGQPAPQPKPQPTALDALQQAAQGPM